MTKGLPPTQAAAESPADLTRTANSQDLIDQYRQIHATRSYGRSSELKTGYIQRELDHLTPIATILDYGCGQSRLVDWLAAINRARGLRYDPAIPSHAAFPVGPVDVVICTDVLEHVPETDIDALLAGIRMLTRHAYFNISLRQAIEILPNGENAHCTVKSATWWGQRIADRFGFARKAHGNDKTSVTWVTWQPRQH